jgi:hypothetical protein
MEYNLLNPGLVENDADGTSCFLACAQMVMRAKRGGSVLSFHELSKLIRRKEGYSWEYAILSYLADDGFQVKFITSFDLRRLYTEKAEYMYEYFGKEAAADQLKHSNMENVYADAMRFVENTNVTVELRVPQKEDLVSLLKTGYYLIPYINQKILQADAGYVSHTVVVYGYSERGVRFHNPGPPATCASEITWELFMRAWSSPSENARILVAVKP